MSDVAEVTDTTTGIADEEAKESIKFGGTPANLVPGMALLIAGVSAFFMSMTDVFFAEAAAWVFIIWGVLLIYAGLVDIYESFEVTEDGLRISNAMKPWAGKHDWAWENVSRLDVVTRKKDSRPRNAKMQIYQTYAGELSIEREDRSFDAELAALIIERAELNPTGVDVPRTMDALPLQQDAVYTWH